VCRTALLLQVVSKKLCHRSVYCK